MSSVTITILQANLHWENPQANLQMFTGKIRGLKGAELVILPEMFSTGFSMRVNELAETMDGATVSWMREIAIACKVVLLGSVIIREDEFFFNRLICMMPTGESVFYDKRHLFAYAGEHNYYTAGTKRLIASIKGWKINLQVCYDLRFPVWARQQGRSNESGEIMPEYDLMIYVANWPAKRSHAWNTLLSARAIENQAYVIGVNRVGSDGNDIVYSGGSQIINPLGAVLYHKTDLEDCVTMTLNKKDLAEIREKFPFLKDGDEFQILS